jgi:hypothetical protein
METAIASNETEEKAKRNEAVSKDKGTFFERNAYWISRQGKKYSKYHNRLRDRGRSKQSEYISSYYPEHRKSTDIYTSGGAENLC